MGNTIRISESQFNRLFKTEDSLNEFISPLREILKCRITEDRKHITYLGRVYDGVTGEELPLTEQALGITKALGTTGKVGASDDDWSISDILHTGVDLISMGADFIVPGSGMAIDIVHALSYMVEAQFSSGEEQDTLYLMGVITGMFALIPGALQAVAPILKRFVKTGGKMALKNIPFLKTAWEIISKNLSSFLSKLPGMVDDAVNSSIGKKILGGNVDKIASAIKNFSTRIKGILDKLKGNTDDVIKAGKEKIKKGKEAIKKKVIDPIIGKKNLKNWESILEKGKVVSKEGVPFNINSSQGKSIIAANPKKYLDKIVFDAQTGKAFAKNSDEGIKTVANNKKFLDSVTGKLSPGQTALDFVDKGIPKEFLKHLDTPLKQTSKIASKVATKMTSKVATKNFSMATLKKANDVLGKFLGYKGLTGNEKNIIEQLYRYTTPGQAGRSLPKNIINLIKGNPQITRFKSASKAIANIVLINIWVSFLTRYLCLLGIKNRDDAERRFELYKNVKIDSPERTGQQADTWIQLGVGILNFAINLADAGINVFDKSCKEGIMPVTFILRTLNDLEFILGDNEVYDWFKGMLSNLNNISDEEIIKIDKKLGKKPKYGTIKK